MKIGINKNINLRKSSVIGHNGNSARPQSVYSKRADTDIFYTNSSLNEYFTQDIKDFSKKINLLNPKYLTKTDKMKKTILLSRCKEFKLQNKLNELVEKNSIFDDKNIKLLANSKNIFPFIKNLSEKSNNEHLKETIINQNTKFYFNSNKPLGEKKMKLNMNLNVRNENMIELKSRYI